MIPTYETGMPDVNPMFFENRVYQGSSGAVYPHPVIDKIFDEKVEKEYVGLFLENRYIKIMILPELGGRVQMAYDKIKQRHFVYYNQVIKPALVGLCGPWISGGIEFNWPQHHRPSTFSPVDYSMEECEDGSKIVWINEVERMSGTKGMAGFILHPGKAYLEIRVKLFNRTTLPQTFLWWANPAVKVNDDYQSIFPPDVHAVFDHGKRDVSSFPIATGTYYKVDYAPGTDISRYKNIPVPTSYMAIHSEYDFLGGYEHDARAGVLHIADHHVSPGKKQWTWGHSDFGKAWDRNLTDEDGPYVELMAGVFTDNQPDFSWLMPYEEKTFTQYFLPYRELGMVKNASKDLMIGLEKTVEELALKIFASSSQDIHVKLLYHDRQLLEEEFRVSPENVFVKIISIDGEMDERDLLLIISNKEGKELLRYEPRNAQEPELPESARPVLAPELIETNEELFLTALHLEQYRHATYSPVPYYEEAIRREPNDIRNNNGLGLWYYRRGQFSKSEHYFRVAIAALTRKNPNPYDGEPYYNLGLCLKSQGKYMEAYDAFYKGTWNAAWQQACFFSLAQLDLLQGNHSEALRHAQTSLDRNAGNSRALVLRCAALRKLGLLDEAFIVADEALQRDRFNLGIYFEQMYSYAAQKEEQKQAQAKEQLKALAHVNEQNYFAYALDYAAAGLYVEAAELLSLVSQEEITHSPLLWYYLAWFHHELKNEKTMLEYLEKAARENSHYCFPNRLEDIRVLELAIDLNKQDAKAPFYLGNLWYDKRQYAEAIANWKLSSQRDSSFPTVFRNLGIAYFNKLKDAPGAVSAYEKAFELNTSDARVFMELDQLYKRLNKDVAERLALLVRYKEVVERRDDLYLERAALYNFLGDFTKAYELIMQRQFHPWEGGEGKVSGQYHYCLVEMAKQQIQLNNFQQAIDYLVQAQSYPHNLGEGKLFGAPENDIFYWTGIAYEELGRSARALEYYNKAAQGTVVTKAAIVYNDPQPDQVFYQGLALIKLQEKDKADRIFRQLIEYGTTQLTEEVRIDYFAVSLPDLLIFDDDLNRRHRVHCHYMAGLGYLGLSDLEKAKQEFETGLQEDAMHLGCKTHLHLISQMKSSSLVATD